MKFIVFWIKYYFFMFIFKCSVPFYVRESKMHTSTCCCVLISLCWDATSLLWMQVMILCMMWTLFYVAPHLLVFWWVPFHVRGILVMIQTFIFFFRYNWWLFSLAFHLFILSYKLHRHNGLLFVIIIDVSNGMYE